MAETPFIITIDTEGDNLWGNPREITTCNASYLPRFQSLCERFRFKPVYLTNYEMAMSEVFVEFARDVLARGAGEVGMHLHAWNSPPLEPLTRDDMRFHPYLIEYPPSLMRAKIKIITGLLEDQFNRAIVSHRAGRWGFDGRYAAMLLEAGYRVDCSVTPGINWRRNLGDPSAKGGTDFTHYPNQTYFLDPSDISRPAAGALLEVPMTTHSFGLYRKAPWAYRVPLLRRMARMVSPGLKWLYPAENTLDEMLEVAHRRRAEGAAHLEFMLHSSELMPGGSPTFRNAWEIERLYENLEMLFDALSRWCRGVTLDEFHGQYAKLPCQEQAVA